MITDARPLMLAEPGVGCLVLHEVCGLEVHQRHEEWKEEQTEQEAKY